MQFEVLSAGGSEGTRWSSLVQGLEPGQRDIHFIPEYGEVYRKTYGFEPLLALYSDGKNYVMQPFVKRLLNNLPFLKDRQISTPYYDIANPYGYGGMISRADSHAKALGLATEFNRSFVAYCKEKGYASEFTSMHPLLGNHQLLAATGEIIPVRQKEVVFIDLRMDEADLWGSIHKRRVRCIKKAQKHGVRTERVEPTEANFDILNRLYYQTMERHNAAARWVFPRDYFRNCLEILGPQRVSLFFAYVGNEVAVATILMHDFDIAYYHFSGSDNNFYEFCPSDLLMYETALWAKHQGYKYFHLGGGVSSAQDDPLYIFKSGFSGSTAPLYSYSRVLNEQSYEKLCALKKSHEQEIDGRESESDYFPLYRR